MVLVKLVGYVGHVAVVVAEFAQVVQEAGTLSGKSMLVLEEQLSEGKFAHLAGEGAEKFAQVVAGQEGSLKLAQDVLVMEA